MHALPLTFFVLQIQKKKFNNNYYHCTLFYTSCWFLSTFLYLRSSKDFKVLLRSESNIYYFILYKLVWVVYALKTSKQLIKKRTLFQTIFYRIKLKVHHWASQQDSSSYQASLFAKAKPRAIDLLSENLNLGISLNGLYFIYIMFYFGT